MKVFFRFESWKWRGEWKGKLGESYFYAGGLKLTYVSHRRQDRHSNRRSFFLFDFVYPVLSDSLVSPRNKIILSWDSGFVRPFPSVVMAVGLVVGGPKREGGEGGGGKPYPDLDTIERKNFEIWVGRSVDLFLPLKKARL